MNNNPTITPKSFVETVILLLLLIALLVALYDVLRVFFGVFTFALIFSVSFSGAFAWLVRKLKNRKTLAAILYSVLLVILVATPLIYIISSISRHTKDMIQWLVQIRTNGIPDLPNSVTRLPLVGNDILEFWKQLQQNPKEAIILHESQVRAVLARILRSGTGMLGVTIEFVAGIIVSAILLVHGEAALAPFSAVMRHLLGDKDGPQLIDATAMAVRGVAIGVMGTAFVAAVISFVGMAIAPVPFALGLSALVFFLVLIQVGPLLVWIPLVIWMAMQGHSGWAFFLAIWGLMVLGIDSILKPVLIAKSGKLPFLVLFLGVIGGLISWGFTGMFKGAIILAVFYTVFTSWLEKTKAEQGDKSPLSE